MPISIKFKTYTDAYDLSSLHPRLKEILNFTIHEANKQGWELEITSIRRQDGGVHQYDRGVDIVPVDRDEEKMQWLRERVNESFDYGKGELQVCPDIHHGTAAHCHFQAWSKTARRSNESD